MITVILLALGTGASITLNVVLMRQLGCVFRKHNTVPLKRIGKHAFVVQCMRCGWLYLKTHEHGQDYYRRYRGQFDEFEDYADERAEAEPTFVEDEGAST